MESYCSMGIAFPLGKWKVLEMDGYDDCTATLMCWMPMNCTVCNDLNGKSYVYVTTMKTIITQIKVERKKLRWCTWKNHEKKITLYVHMYVHICVNIYIFKFPYNKLFLPYKCIEKLSKIVPPCGPLRGGNMHKE
jgi:hypothetical protein